MGDGHDHVVVMASETGMSMTCLLGLVIPDPNPAEIRCPVPRFLEG